MLSLSLLVCFQKSLFVVGFGLIRVASGFTRLESRIILASGPASERDESRRTRCMNAAASTLTISMHLTIFSMHITISMKTDRYPPFARDCADEGPFRLAVEAVVRGVVVVVVQGARRYAATRSCKMSSAYPLSDLANWRKLWGPT